MADIIVVAIFTLLGLSGIFAFIFSQIPQEQQHFRLLFLLLSLLMCIATIWSAFAAKQTVNTQFYDDQGVFIGNQTITSELDPGIKHNLVGIGQVLGVILGLLLFIILAVFAFDKATAAAREKREQQGYLSDV